MEIIGWYQTAGAVFAGNILSALFAYSVWAMVSREKRGLNPYDIGLGPALCGIIPPLVVIGGLYLMRP